ncbi:hypothetical protein VTP01DRAFT_4870 [Rhizomucor pusillus]|uniref:uncharacterized protein n=1 Tax=Rhizomucor pusillus TaxID=4840 RepID=UPI00374305D2
MKTIIVLLSWLLLACWFVDATSTLRRSAPPSSLVLDHASSHRRRSPSVPRAVRVLQAKQKRGGGDSNKSTFKGTGTWFIPSTEGGSEGACEVNNEDDAKIVALNAEQYGDSSSKSKWCGKKVKITAGGKSATATITDECPECDYGDLDLTTAVFKELADLDEGVIDITWKVVSDDD